MRAASTTTRTFAMLALGGVLMAGCGSSDEPDETTTRQARATPTQDAAPTTTEPAAATEVPAIDETEATTEPDSSGEEQDAADVGETLRLYTKALDDAFNGDSSVEAIYPYARDTAREQWVTQVMASQAQGITSTGLTELEVIEVAIDGDTAEVVACADVSAVEVLDENGESIVTEDRLDQTLQDFVLERDESAELGWYVVSDVNRDEPCDD